MLHAVQNNPQPHAEPSWQHARPFEEIPGHPGWPILGNTVPLITRPISFLVNWYDKYGSVSRTRSAGADVVLLLGPENNERVLLNRDREFSSREGLKFYMEPFFTNGLVLWDFEEHQMHRGIMRQAFRPERLESYLGVTNPIIDAGIESWLVSRAGRQLNRHSFFYFRKFKKLALDLATTLFMGAKIGREGGALIQAFQDIVAASVAIVRYPIPGTAYDRGLRSRKKLERYFYSHIREKRANPGNDFFSQLCIAENEDGRSFNDEEIVNHMIFLMMAAHDTTTITTTRTVYHLAKHPKWQERLRAESRDLNKPWLDYEDLPKMHGIDVAMKESLRMLAPVPGLPRKAIKDCVVGGYRIPAGTMVQVDMRHTHYMEEYWPEPFKFDPERFADGGQENKLHKYAWLPFGGGAHKCIGRHFADHQVKALVHQLLLKYRWSVPTNYRMPIKNPGLPMPRDNFPVRFERIL